jgi:hypothetical protein
MTARSVAFYDHPMDGTSPRSTPRLTRILALCIIVTATVGVAKPAHAATSNLSCAQMKARGYSYGRAVAYWRAQVYPRRLDADDNGIPCETVYSAAAVRNYWGSRTTFSGELASGFTCREILDQGYSYGDALAYWTSEGYPSRMDADNNGIPCETVYPASEVKKYFRIY